MFVIVVSQPLDGDEEQLLKSPKTLVIPAPFSEIKGLPAFVQMGEEAIVCFRLHCTL